MATTREVKEDPKAQKASEDFARLSKFQVCVDKPSEGNDKIVKVADDLFYAVARKTLNIMGSWSKYISYMGCTMTIIKSGDTLTLVNAARLKVEDMNALDDLGTVKNIVRIGSFHGSSDPFYLNRYKDADYWVLEGMVLHDGLAKQPKILKDGSVPVQGMKVFMTPGSNRPEGMLYLPSNGGTLITCDALQNNVDLFPPQTSYLMAIFMALQGFRGKARIGPGFVEFSYSCWGVDAKPVLTKFFADNILKEKISILMPGHGTPLTKDVVACIKESLSLLK